MSSSTTQHPRRSRTSVVAGPLFVIALTIFGQARLSAQSLNWEGQTGVFVTPLAYTASSTSKGFGKPIVAYHYLNAGPVLGDFHQASATIGLLGRIEFGYTRSIHAQGSTPGLSPLWGKGFNIFHGKLNLVAENTGKRAWVPALSVGAVGRTNVRNVGGAIRQTSTNNADFYVVATKTVTQVKGLPLVFNLGYKATNASVLALAGNAPGYKGRLFGAAAFVLTGPGKSQIVIGSELAQQPLEVQDLAGARVPTTLTYALRIVPSPAHAKFNVDLGAAQAANHVAPGVDLKARHQFALGISYGF